MGGNGEPQVKDEQDAHEGERRRSREKGKLTIADAPHPGTDFRLRNLLRFFSEGENPACKDGEPCTGTHPIPGDLVFRNTLAVPLANPVTT